MRKYKCYYCKELIEENPIEIITGKSKLIKRRVHQKCLDIRNQKQKIRMYLEDLLEVPFVDTNIQKRIFNLNNKGYDWEVILHAIRAKNKPIKQNFLDKGWNYIFAIIQNQIPISYKLLQKEKERVFTYKEENEIINMPDIKGKKYETKDYTDILNLELE